MAIMLYVYSKIFCVLTSRQSRISRAEASILHDFNPNWVTKFHYRLASARSTLKLNTLRPKLTRAAHKAPRTWWWTRLYRQHSTSSSSTQRPAQSWKITSRITTTARTEGVSSFALYTLFSLIKAMRWTRIRQSNLRKKFQSEYRHWRGKQKRLKH